MSTDVAMAASVGTDAQTDQRLVLHSRFLQAGLADPRLFDDIPKDASLYLLPDDDPAFVEREIAQAAESARRGRNVYLCHVRVADLPELSDEPSGSPVGLRRTSFNWDGSIASQEIRGSDGAWHAVNPPEPVDD